MSKVQLIVNPIAGRGRAARAVPAIVASLRQLGYEPVVSVTRRRGEAREAAAALDWRTALVVVVGGDGTLHEVVNGQSKVPVALLPAGTGNAFAWDQGLPRSAAGLEGLLRGGRIEWFDLGDAGGRRFLSMVGAGVLGEIHRAFWHDRKGPDRWLRCLGRAIQVWRRRQARPVAVWCDGELVARAAALVVVGNTRTYARGIRFTPRASPQDGLLDVCAIPEPAGLDTLRWFLALLRGRHLDDPRIVSARGRTVRIAGPDIHCHADGEYLGRAPLTVTVLPRSVPILVPGTRPGGEPAPIGALAGTWGR